jgi:hypothetical protein
MYCPVCIWASLYLVGDTIIVLRHVTLEILGRPAKSSQEQIQTKSTRRWSLSQHYSSVAPQGHIGSPVSSGTDCISLEVAALECVLSRQKMDPPS